ncbi:MAG: DUF262 domain-containing protein [Oceanicaulis sp.]
MPETVYTKVDYPLSALIEYIRLGDIALPDLQRPFVWKNAKIRNLFDSMYRGYPVGYLLFWKPSELGGAHAIGAGASPQHQANLLIVDGQQRLTALYAVITGSPVVRENYSTETVSIAFDPVAEKFEVTDAAIRRDPRFIPNITDVLKPGADAWEIAEAYLDRLEQIDPLDPDVKRRARKAIQGLANLRNYPFTALELSPAIDEEQVAEVFVRINSEGKKLNQSDFILTLMSVFWEDGRKALEAFCGEARQPKAAPGASAHNLLFRPDPDQLLRVAVGLGFRRARLKSVYSLLRGKDMDADEVSVERRDAQFEILREAQGEVLNLTHWHEFLKAVRSAGFQSDRMISSKNALVFAYTLYLIGRTQFGIPINEMRPLISAWLFMTSLTGRYTSSPESAMEADLAALRNVTTAEEFVARLKRIQSSVLTSDYWAITLPNDLATSAATGPSKNAYFAALAVLGAKALYSNQPVKELMDRTAQAKRSAVETHHLFPKGYLRSLGVTSARETNQIANYAVAEWSDNASFGDRAPADYAPEAEAKFSGRALQDQYFHHALPDGWMHMEYRDFLEKRRELIAGVIRQAYDQLQPAASAEAEDDTVSIQELIEAGEGTEIEFKSTLRRNLHTGENDPRMETAVLKTIVGFLNSRTGGALVIGVTDDGEAVGMDADGFANEDKALLHLGNLIEKRVSGHHAIYIHPRFDEHEGVRVLRVEVDPARSPAYLRDGAEERLFVRASASTRALSGSETDSFIRARFG